MIKLILKKDHSGCSMENRLGRNSLKPGRSFGSCMSLFIAGHILGFTIKYLLRNDYHLCIKLI